MLTLIIIAVTCLVSIPAFINRDLFTQLLFNGPMIHSHRQWYRFITHALLHADWVHLFMNMYMLWMFGKMVEEVYIDSFGIVKGEVLYFLLYFISILASSFPSYQKHKDDSYYNSVGASGAVSAVVFSAILLNPWMSLSMMFIPIPIPAPIFGLLYLVYCWYAAKNARDNVAHDVHYWGSLYGLVFTLVILPSSFLNLVDAIKDIF